MCSLAIVHLYIQSLSGYKMKSMLRGLSDVAYDILTLKIICSLYMEFNFYWAYCILI